MACQNGYLSIVSKLLDFKLEVNKCDNDDRSPLYAACQEGYAEIVMNLRYCTDLRRHDFPTMCRQWASDLPYTLRTMVKTHPDRFY
jgi:ankyrin repeat protein